MNTGNSDPSRNASASMFGWQFQIESAIYLMLSDLKKYTSLNIEGYEEDIELETTEGTLVLAQAKSSINWHEPIANESKSNYNKKVKENLKKALSGLHTSKNKYERNNKKIQKLIYISNFNKPFGATCTSSWNDCEILHYKELDPPEKAVVKKLFPEFSDEILNNFTFQSLPFKECEDYHTAHKHVIRKIKKLFTSLEIENCEEITYLQKLHSLCNYQATNVKSKYKKADFVWLAIVTAMPFECSKFADLFPELDDIKTTNRIKQKYYKIIDEYSNRFTILNRILKEYANYKPREKSNAIKLKQFINEKHNLLDDILSNEIDQEEKTSLKKYIIYQIITTRYHINKAFSEYLDKYEN